MPIIPYYARLHLLHKTKPNYTYYTILNQTTTNYTKLYLLHKTSPNYNFYTYYTKLQHLNLLLLPTAPHYISYTYYTKLHQTTTSTLTTPNYTYCHQPGLGVLKNIDFLFIPPRLAVNV